MLVDYFLDLGGDLFGLAASILHMMVLRPPWSSLKGIMSMNQFDEAIYENAADAREGRAQRNDLFRECIREEVGISRFCWDSAFDLSVSLCRRLFAKSTQLFDTSMFLCQCN